MESLGCGYNPWLQNATLATPTRRPEVYSRLGVPGIDHTSRILEFSNLRVAQELVPPIRRKWQHQEAYQSSRSGIYIGRQHGTWEDVNFFGTDRKFQECG